MIEKFRHTGGLFQGRGLSPEVKKRTARENLLHLAKLFGIGGTEEEKIIETQKMCEMINGGELGVYARLGNLAPARIKRIDILMDLAYLEDPKNFKKEICAKMHSVHFEIVDVPSIDQK